MLCFSRFQFPVTGGLVRGIGTSCVWLISGVADDSTYAFPLSHTASSYSVTLNILLTHKKNPPFILKVINMGSGDSCNIESGQEECGTSWGLTGLNHESTEMVYGIPVLDLEITSNRGDCLGHIGIAREASVLLNTELRYPAPKLKQSEEPVSKFLTIENQFEAACPRYIGRLIRGVKIGPSPDWLEKRLESIGVKSINNVVDVTNYVMFLALIHI